MAKRLLSLGQQANLTQVLEQPAAFQALCHHGADHAEAPAALRREMGGPAGRHRRRTGFGSARRQVRTEAHEPVPRSPPGIDRLERFRVSCRQT
jgi:hypothetical protein